MEMTDDDRRAMGIRGHTLVATKFSWPRIGEQMRSVYEWMLGGGAVPETVRLQRAAADARISHVSSQRSEVGGQSQESEIGDVNDE
jgi:hypothetical protein